VSAMAAAARPYPGLFVVLEGIDGAGTTTQTERLVASLRAEGYRAFSTREPSDGPIGTMIRQALTGRMGLPGHSGPIGAQTLALLFAADRVDHLEAQILPALDRGEIVICDRYVLSSLAYQGLSLPVDWVSGLNAFAARPDVTLFLDVDVSVASQRRARRGGAPELFEDDEQQERISRQYDAAIRKRIKTEKIVRIDGAQPVEQITAQALKALRPLLKKAEREQ
jgi:dTMP kinase